MGVTKSYVFLTALGAVVTFAAWQLGGAYAAMFLFWNGLLVGLLLLDMLLTPGKRHFSVRREDGDVLYFLAENDMAFFVKNNSRHALQVEGRDESFRFFERLPDSDLVHWVLPRQEAEFSYAVLPAKRGSFSLGGIYLRWSGIFGLCVKHVKFPAPMEFKVYPNVRDLSKFRLAVQKNRLLPTGDKKIKNYGVGYEFESLRPYVDGDDYRKINWRASSRESRLIVNQFQTERNQPVNILLDIGRPMSYAVGGYKKLDYAINAAIVLADIVNQSGDKAGLMVFDSAVRTYIPPGQGASHRSLLMETLYHVEENRATADFGGAFRTLCEAQKRRSLVFIFTDFELPEEARELIFHIGLLKKRHLPIVIFMENEKLDALAEIPVRKKFDGYLRETAREFQTERRNIFRQLNAMGIPCVESKAEDFSASAVNNYIRRIG